MLDRLRARLGNVRERAREVLAPPAPGVAASGRADAAPTRDRPTDPSDPARLPSSGMPAQAPATTLPAMPASRVEGSSGGVAGGGTPRPQNPRIHATEPDAPGSVLPAVPAPRLLYADTSSTDRAAYRARALAAGRDPAGITGDEGRNVAPDGAAFWGPLDNESSRAKAEDLVLSIDPHDCISCGTCVEQTEAVFQLPDDATAIPVAQDGPMDLIQDAIDACPVTCIRWVTRHEASERGLTTGR